MQPAGKDKSSAVSNVETVSQSIDSIELTVLPIRLQSKLPQTIGFTFPESPAFNVPSPSEKESARSNINNTENPKPLAEKKPSVQSPSNSTRIKPPRDLVKLEDRLYFVLQPPLETLVATARLDFPFQPFPYQFEGIAFLFPRESAILADEMGLGKTMQAITTVRMLLLSSQLRNVLLICPKPLVTIGCVSSGNGRQRFRSLSSKAIKQSANTFGINKILQCASQNYELLMRDRALLDIPDMHFDLVVLDEAQRIKNRNSTTAEIVRALPRTRSWALTGTPIENSVDDLVNIFEFLQPGYLRSDMSMKAITQASKDFIIRRTKDKVLTEMPPKMFRDEELELTAAQQDSYRIAEDEGVVQLDEMGDTLTIQHVFELVLRLKQICNFDPATGTSCKLERLEADMEEIAASGQKAIVFTSGLNRSTASQNR